MQSTLFKPSHAVQAVIFLCTVNNIMHGAVFYHFSFHGLKPVSYWQFFSSPENFQSFFVMFVVDVALISLVAFGNNPKDTRTAGVLAVFLFIINILFADVLTDVFTIHISNTRAVTALIGKFLFSGLFSYIIWYFADLNVRLRDETKEKEGLKKLKIHLEQLMKTANESTQHNEAILRQIEAETKQQEALRLHAEALEEQVKAMKTEAALEVISRTLYRANYEPWICESSRALNARFGALPEDQKKYHLEMRQIQENQAKNTTNLFI